MGFPVNETTGSNQSTSLATAKPIRIPDTAGAPNLTENVNVSFNVDSRSEGISAETNFVGDPSYIEEENLTQKTLTVLLRLPPQRYMIH